MNATLYRQRLSLMKQFGFDFVRLHSHFEAPAYVTIWPRFYQSCCFEASMRA